MDFATVYDYDDYELWDEPVHQTQKHVVCPVCSGSGHVHSADDLTQRFTACMQSITEMQALLIASYTQTYVALMEARHNARF